MIDNSFYAVLFSIGVYVLYVLVPLIPSILIYKIFPDTKVSISGPLSNLKLNASGAFAGYIVVVILGYSQIEKAQELTAGLAYPTWTVTCSVILQDSLDKPIPHSENMLNGLRVVTTPELVKTAGKNVTLSIPGIKDPMRTISLILPGFGQKNINLQQELEKNEIKQDELHKQLDIGEVIITQLPKEPINYFSDPTATIVKIDSSGPPTIP
jgi:hypothetical protein